MTRAEFFGIIFNMEPADALIQIEEPRICHYPKCTESSCDQCKSDMSYWMSEFTKEDTDIITPEKYKEVYDKYIGSKINGGINDDIIRKDQV